MRFEDIDWATWKPKERAVLVYLRRSNMILLGRKKHGLGAGLYNGIGGRVNEGETAYHAALREFKEETGAKLADAVPVGELSFAFVDGYGQQVRVYVANRQLGELRETVEIKPKWFREVDIPYGEMWPDDRIWVPWMLEGKHFRCRFLLTDDKKIVGCSMEVHP